MTSLKPPRVLIVEDEPDIASVLADYLRLEHCETQVVHDGLAAMQMILGNPPDLVLLDLMLPGLDGLGILRNMRAQEPRQAPIPIIMITARVEEVDRLIGLNLGADDYICKPFSPREVVARVKAVLRRTRPGTAGEPASADVTHSLPAVLEPWLSPAGTPPSSFTRKETQLLQILARQPGRVFSRGQLLACVYADELDANERAVDSHIKNLRRKMAALLSGHEWIRSVYGVGFCLEIPADSGQNEGGGIH